MSPIDCGVGLQRIGQIQGTQKSIMNSENRAGKPAEGRMPQCRGAVVRAYDNLRTAGIDDRHAFLAAARLYRTHHPEADMKSARFRVAAWIYDRPQGDAVTH